jgi:hypothetical protein
MCLSTGRPLQWNTVPLDIFLRDFVFGIPIKFVKISRIFKTAKIAELNKQTYTHLSIWPLLVIINETVSCMRFELRLKKECLTHTNDVHVRCELRMYKELNTPYDWLQTSRYRSLRNNRFKFPRCYILTMADSKSVAKIRRNHVVCVKLLSTLLQNIHEICALLGYYAASCGNYLPTFRDNVLVPSSWVKSL